MSIHDSRKQTPLHRIRVRKLITELAILATLALTLLSLEACSGSRSLTKVPATIGQTQPSSVPDTDDTDDSVDVDRLPEMIHYETPVYPRLAQAAGIEGTVWIKSFVLTDGKVSEAKVHESSGSSGLDQAALDAARKCRFEPAIRDGKLVASWATYKVEFRLSDVQGGR